MSHITATQINLLHVCQRELWLHTNEVRMEHTSDIVTEGKLIGETSYTRRAERYTQIEVDGVKIDFYDPQTHTVHETKRGKAMEAAHRAQVQYYLYKLRQLGIQDATGLIEYPELRRTEPVPALQEGDISRIEGWIKYIEDIMKKGCPPVINKPICKQCSYYDLCYADEA